MTAGPGFGYGYGYGPPGGGRWMAGAEYARLRACDADREQTADVLRAAFVEGRLTQDELDTRLGAAYTARTYADLAEQTSDLPVARQVPMIPRPAPVYHAGTTNGMAIGAFICGLLQLVSGGLTSIPAVILGHAARRQIRRTGQRGEGLATAGLVLGWLGIAFLVLCVILATAAIAGMGRQGFPAGP
jgi:Domain of unknown function (DUF4190)/Domain of unknown function (DUF1707)